MVIREGASGFFAGLGLGAVLTAAGGFFLVADVGSAISAGACFFAAVCLGAGLSGMVLMLVCCRSAILIYAGVLKLSAFFLW